MPAQSPTLSPTLSAMTAGLRGSSSGMPASTLPTRSAPPPAPLGEADHQHAGDRAALEGDVERLVHALAGRLGGTHVSAHRDVHADEAAGTGQHRAGQEADGGPGAEQEVDGNEQYQADDADGAVLAPQVGGGALLDRERDFLHAGVARILAQDPGARPEPVDDRDDTTRHGKRDQVCCHIVPLVLDQITPHIERMPSPLAEQSASLRTANL